VSIFQRARVAIIRPLVDNDLVARILFSLRLCVSNLQKKDIVILATTTKTGTHYVRFLLAYYAALWSEKYDNGPVVEVDHAIVDSFFPNSWHSGYTFVLSRKQPDYRIGALGIKDLPRSHMSLRSFSWRGVRVLHTYRDRKDQAMVSWFMKFNCDRRFRSAYSGPQDLYDNTRDETLAQYSSFADIAKGGTNSLRISFENLFHDPSNTLALILYWLGLEPDRELCERAVSLAKQTQSILVGGGEKWHRFPNEHVDYAELQEFIESNLETGAIGIGRNILDT